MRAILCWSIALLRRATYVTFFAPMVFWACVLWLLYGDDVSRNLDRWTDAAMA